MAVATIAPARGHPRDSGPARIFESRRQRAFDVGVTADYDAVAQIADAGWPIGYDVVCQPGDVFDDDNTQNIRPANPFPGADAR